MSVGLLPNSARRSDEPTPRHRVAVLIPCLNEEQTVAAVVHEFQAELPDAAIWVIDNGSTDDTIGRAKAAGARIIFEPRKGKGFAIRAAFRDIEADVYVLADGDGQLPASSVHDLINPVLEGDADMVVGSRAAAGAMSHSAINNLGNVLFSRILRSLLHVRVTDVLSGYRALSRVLVKSLPLTSHHFEIEVELTIKTSQRMYRIREIPFQVRPRDAATQTHLRVFRDGLSISWAILLLFRDYRPLAFFTLFGTGWMALAILMYGLTGGAGTFLIFPTGILTLLAAIVGLLSFTVGAMLSVVSRRMEELEGKVDRVTTVGLGRDSED